VPNVRISFHPAVAAEVEAAVQWYAEQSPVVARAFAAEVNAGVECLRSAGGHFVFASISRLY
jgi:hypothetical protein